MLKIYLQKNEIKDNGVIEIGKSFDKLSNLSLLILNLNENIIEEKGAI